MRRDEIEQFAFVVDRGEDRRLRIGARDVREDPFGSAALVEVVVDECNAQRPIAALGLLLARAVQLICVLPRGTINATVNFRR
jgi:hypothetical protein